MLFFLRLTSLSALLVIAISCSDGSGKQPLVTMDGTLPGDDAVEETTGEQQDVVVPEEISDGSSGPEVDSAQQELVEDLSELDDGAELEIYDLQELPDLVPELTEPDLMEYDQAEVEVIPDTIYPPGPECGDIFKCGLSQGCADDDDVCWAECANEAEDDALLTFQAIQLCATLHCSQLPDSEQGDCLMAECLTEVYECLGAEGNSDCLSTFKCIQSCGEDDGFCIFGCIEGSDKETLAVILAMSSAGEMEGLALMVECAGGKGELTCGAAVLCVTNCEGDPPPDDPGSDPAVDCMFDCIGQTSPEAAEQLAAFLGCTDEMCPDGMDDCQGIFFCLDECPGISF
jgi:hypothetical protein